MSRRVEEWRNIPGYGEQYQISDWGRVRSFYQRGQAKDTPRILAIRMKKGTPTVSLRRNKTSVREPVTKLMALTWLGGIPAGMKAVHKDGDLTDNSRWNIVLLTKGDQLRNTDGIYRHSRKPVLKIDETLDVVAAYSSASDAARANHFDRATIIQRCNLYSKITSVFATDGFIYAWDDPAFLRIVLRRARKELTAKGIRYNEPFTERYFDIPAHEETEIDLNDIPWEDVPACGGGHYFRACRIGA